MPEIFSSNSTLSDSNLGVAPNFMTDFVTGYSYTNGNVLQKIEEHRHHRQRKFPTLRDRYGYDSSEVNVKIRHYLTKRNVEEELQPVAPHRIYDSVIDPTSGFVSAGCDAGGKAGNTQVESMVQLDRKPQSLIPEVQNTRQNMKIVPLELKRFGAWCPGTPTTWNSRKTPEVWIRAKLGGWTSDIDPRKAKDFNKQSQTFVIGEQNESTQHKLALKYIYGTSTQRGYEDVPWDILLRPKRWPPTLAVEEKPDISLYHRNLNTRRCNSANQKWQAEGGSELFLPRYSYRNDRPVTGTIPVNQIELLPLYRPVSLDKPQTSSFPDHGRKSGISKNVTFGPS